MKFASRSKEHLKKARDSALLAVEVYNKPAIAFRTGGYVTMMTIASTSLFHAIFFKERKKPFYKDKSGRFERIDNDYRYWELSTCLKEYYGGKTDAVRTNFEFFIPLRNKIEHRSMPQIDGTLFAECQALLLNFDALIEKEFGAKYALRETLSFSLQFFPKGGGFDINKPKPEEKDVVDFITSFRSSLSPEVYSDSRYAFKAFLIKVGNHQASDAVPIKIVDFDSLSEEQKAELPKFALLVKSKEVSVHNLDLMKPAEVVSRVQKGIGGMKVRKLNGFNPNNFKLEDRFNLAVHTLLWKKFGVRPEPGASSPAKTKKEYCVYDALNKNYGFTQKWVEFLIEKVKDDALYLSLFKNPNAIQIV